MVEISSRLSVHSKGISPHNPHSHIEEELLIILSGEVKLIHPDIKDSKDGEEFNLTQGQFIYYPSNFLHTFIAMSNKPVHCLTLFWKTKLDNKSPRLGYAKFNIPKKLNGSKELQMKTLFEGPTAYLKKLHCHTSVIRPGGEVKAHRDIYDVVSIIIEGEVESMDKKAVPYDVIFYPAGKPHDLRNKNTKTAREIVFEFHTYQIKLLYKIPYYINYYFRKNFKLKYLKRNLKKVLKRLLPVLVIRLLKKIYDLIRRLPKKISKNILIDYFRCNLFISRHYRHEMLFSNIEIETVNRCNGVCQFCPVNSLEKQRPYKKMSETLFYKIIKELKELGFKGSISLYSNNEPFLDERIIKFYSHVRKSLTGAYVFIYTNGTLLTKEKFQKILPFVDRMVINNYSDNNRMHPNILKIYDCCHKHPELRGKVVISMIQMNQVRTSRGGQAPNKGKQKAPKRKCTLPFRQIIVRPDGKISLCSNDALGVYTLGDANTQTLEEIWKGMSCREVRGEMKKNGRKNLRLCQDCDNLFVSNILTDYS